MRVRRWMNGIGWEAMKDKSVVVNASLQVSDECAVERGVQSMKTRVGRLG